LATLVVAGVVAALPATLNAQSAHRARLSQDLVQRIDAGDTQATSVIVTGSQERIDRIAARLGLRVHKRLESGAVLDVPAGSLAALASDVDADQMSGNLVVQAHEDITNQTIGADIVQAGNWSPGLRSLTGKGIGVAVIDSGVANMVQFGGRVVVSKDFTDERGPGIDRGPAEADLEVEMWAGRVPGGADGPDLLALAHPLADDDVHAGQVRQHRPHA